MTYSSYNSIFKILPIKESPAALTMFGRLTPCSCYLLNLTQPVSHLPSGSASFYSLAISRLSSTTPFFPCSHLSSPLPMKPSIFTTPFITQPHSFSSLPSLTPSYNRKSKPNFVFREDFLMMSKAL